MDIAAKLVFGVLVFVLGTIFGSFLNVVIFRVPKHESVNKRSHCMSCGYQLRWYDLVPLFSWIFLGGKCRVCKNKISKQYPIIEGLNGLFYLGVYLKFYIMDQVPFITDVEYDLDGNMTLHYDWYSVIIAASICALLTALLGLTVIDWRTFEIPFGFNVFITVIAVIHGAAVILHNIRIAGNGVADTLKHFLPLYFIGFFAVSLILYIIYAISKGRAIGGGDIKLMAAAGLFLGWKNIILAFVIGCIVGSIIHLIRMKVSKAEHVLAMGPYLSLGIALASLYGNIIVNWYLSMFSAS